MNNLVSGLAKAYAVVAAYTLTLLGAVAIVLFSTGSLTGERVKEAVAVLRAPTETPAERTSLLSDEERRELERTQRIRQETLESRDKELLRLESRVVGMLSTARGQQDELDVQRKRLDEDRTKLDQERQALAAAKSDAEVAANLPILSKLDGVGIVSLMKGWDDARFVRYLRALKPGKAAEVLETVRTDPQFEPDFRKLPEDASPGTKTRAERLVDEFKKVP